MPPYRSGGVAQLLEVSIEALTQQASLSAIRSCAREHDEVPRR
jgi:hypothetical protein